VRSQTSAQHWVAQRRRFLTLGRKVSWQDWIRSIWKSHAA
jgi:hypothetical protein